MDQSAVVTFQDQIMSQAQNWYYSRGLAESAFSQWLLIFATFFLAFLGYRFWLRPWIDSKIKEQGEELGFGRHWFVLTMCKRLFMPVLQVCLLWIASGVARHHGWPHEWLHIASILLIALILSQLITIPIILQKRRPTSRSSAVLITFAIWLIAALEISHLLAPTLELLNRIDLRVGGGRLSLLHLITGGLLLTVFLWLSRTANNAFATWVKTVPSVSPSFQVLFLKLFKVGFFTLAIIITLGGLGLDLSNLAWFSGAIGLGLGFGLQKVISNLASGFIILADKSIKPGDVIQVGETYGWINHLGSRYVSVITRDGIEYLIPNEDMITGKVINWSYSHNLVRLKIPVSIAYGSDLELAMKLMLGAAQAVSRVLPEPEPSCRLMNFGDSSINFQLRVWINDPRNGVSGVSSEFFLGVWKRFQEHGIEIPFPQRVLYHKEVPEIKVANSQGSG